jgi:hypothetical protein
MLAVKVKLQADAGVNHPLRTIASSYDAVSVVPNMMHMVTDLTACMQFNNILHNTWRPLLRVSLLVCSVCLLPHDELCIKTASGVMIHVPSFMTIISGLQKVLWGIYIQTYKHTDSKVMS